MAIYIFFSDADDHKELHHDVETSIPKTEEWKAHILRAAHGKDRRDREHESEPGTADHGLGDEVSAGQLPRDAERLVRQEREVVARVRRRLKKRKWRERGKSCRMVLFPLFLLQKQPCV